MMRCPLRAVTALPTFSLSWSMLVVAAILAGNVADGGNGTMPFSRADCNGDGKVNLADAIICANNIFQSNLIFFDCDNMLDANDDGILDGSDPLRIISWFFVGDVDIPEPFRTCDVDDDSDLACAFSNCLCDNYGLYFGTDPNVADLNVTGSSLAIIMRNAQPALGFSFGVEVTRNGDQQSYRFVNSLGLDQDRLVDVVIVDDGGEERALDATNQAQGGVEDIIAVERAAALAGISGDFFAVDLEPNTGTGFTVVYATDLAGATGATIPPSPIENGGCQVNEIVSVRFARLGDCPDWSLLFGDDPNAELFEISSNATSFPITMRNAGDVLGFSFGATVANGDYAFADQTLGKLPDRLVDLVITDTQGIEHVPETNAARDGLVREIASVDRGSLLAGVSDDFLSIDLEPPIGGPGFTVGYSTDVSGSGFIIPANSNPNDECDLNEILVINYGGDPGVFNRGDCNGDGRLNVTDAAICAQNIFLNRIVFFDCEEMLDANNDDELDTSDPITIMMWVFANGPDLPGPFMACGLDPNVDDLGCLESNCTP